MRLLFEMDKKDYGKCTHTFVRNSARSIIIVNNKIAMIRETREESGLVVKPETIKEYGYVHRIQKSDLDETECFVQDNYYYLCEAEEYVVAQSLDEYEFTETYTLEFVDPETAIRKNRNVTQTPHNQAMFEREARVLELLMAEGLLD